MYQIKGKIDSTNAPDFEKELMAALPTEIDASELEYISSAGLRVLLRLTKTVGDVTLYNVSIDVYEILDVTGFTSILNVKKALREISVDGCEMIGAGGYGSVYRINEETIVKVYHTASLDFIEKERELSKKAFLLGVPTAISFDTVKVGSVVIHRTKTRINRKEILNVISAILKRGLVERIKPQCIKAAFLYIIKFLCYTLQIADTVMIGILKRCRVYFIHNKISE